MVIAMVVNLQNPIIIRAIHSSACRKKVIELHYYQEQEQLHPLEEFESFLVLSPWPSSLTTQKVSQPTLQLLTIYTRE